MKGKSPTQRSLALMRKRGYPLVQVVEKWNPHAGPFGVRQDLFGILDVLCVGADVVGVQATSYSGVSHRIAKIRDAEIDKVAVLPVLRNAGIRVLVHGWRKHRGHWIVREVEMS